MQKWETFTSSKLSLEILVKFMNVNTLHQMYPMNRFGKTIDGKYPEGTIKTLKAAVICMYHRVFHPVALYINYCVTNVVNLIYVYFVFHTGNIK